MAALLHIPIASWFLNSTFLRPETSSLASPLRVSLVEIPPSDEEEEPAEVEDPLDGQIVEIAPPEDARRPDEAEFLAEYDSTVPEESVDRRFRVDREITAPTFSPDDLFEMEEATDRPSPESPSSGSMAGREVFRNGRFSLYPDKRSPWDLPSSTEGLATEIASSHERSRLAGSPSNDHLPEVASSDRTALNAHEFLYAAFWNRVKQLVSFYADQTLANARPRVAIRKPRYEMTLTGLIALDGRLVALDIERSSGVREWDLAIKEAFHLAAPFPDPPEGAADPSTGLIPIRSFGFTIMVGGARAEMSGIDPRQSIQFPGLQTIPR